MSSQAEEVLFALKEVTFAYGKDDAAVLRKLTLEIPAGKTTVIMGSSGAGKSTLLSLLGLLWEQDRSHAWQLREGSIAYRREDLQTPQPHTVNYHDLSDADRAYLRSNDFGFVLQSCYLLPFFTCLQNISMPLAMRGLSQSECRQHVVDALHRVAAILEESNLSYPGGDGSATPQAIPEETIPSTPTANDMLGVLDEYKIAGGQRQRAAVLRALIHKPKIIFADEPFSNLDPDNARQYLRILKDWQSGRDASADGGTVKAAARRTLVIVCHDPRVAIEIGEYGLFLYPRSKSRSEPRWHFTSLAGLEVQDVETLMKDPPTHSPVTASPTVPAIDRVWPGSPGNGTFLGRLGFATWFAWKDLWQHRKARSVAWVLLMTMIGLVGLPTVFFGLIFGWEAYETASMQNDAIAHSLLLHTAPHREALIRDEHIQKLRISLNEKRIEVTGIYPARELDLDWIGANRQVPARGRTLADGDPLLTSCDMLFETAPEDPGTPGVWISDKLLHALKAPRPPTKVKFVLGGDVQVGADVRNVLAHELPEDGGSFLIRETTWTELRKHNPNPKWKEIVSGPVPEDWLAVQRLPNEVLDLLRAKEIKPPHPAGRLGDVGHVWAFRDIRSNPTPRMKEWKTVLDIVRQKMVRAGFSDSQAFVGQAEGKEPEPDLFEEEMPDYSWVAVYVKDVRRLRDAAKVADSLSYAYNKDAIERIDRISETVVMLTVMLIMAMIIFACLVVGNMYSIQNLRAMQKDSEIGWLKAMGLPNNWLGAVFLLQAGMLWLGGLVIGLLIGLCAAQFISRLALTWITSKEPFDARWPFWFFFVIAVVPAAISVGATWRATSRARNTPPIESLVST